MQYHFLIMLTMTIISKAEDIISAAENMRLWVWLRDSWCFGPWPEIFSLQRAVFSLHVHLFSLDLKCILSRPFLRLHVWVLRAWGWGEVGDGSSGGRVSVEDRQQG